MPLLKATFNLPPASDSGHDPVLLTVKAEDVATPHEVLFRIAAGLVVDARTRDFGESGAIPTETVETLLKKTGTNLPTGNEEIVIRFNPSNGEVIDVLPKSAEKKAATIH